MLPSEIRVGDTVTWGNESVWLNVSGINRKQGAERIVLVLANGGGIYAHHITRIRRNNFVFTIGKNDSWPEM